MKTVTLLSALTTLILLTIGGKAATFYVDVSNAVPIAPYNNWPTAATNIQDAIDASSDGDLILVTNGVYGTGGRVVYGTLTNRVVINKAVTVQSVNGPTTTVIQGYRIPAGETNFDNDVRCVYMTNNAVLVGFTITNGATRAAGSSIPQLAGGGVFCESTNAVLTNCILTGNMCASRNSTAGGGAVSQGTLNNCVLSNNVVVAYAVRGGAACQSVLNYCLIASNSASIGGGAAFSTLNHCAVIGNVAPFFGSTSWGGGTYMCSANYCLIAGNFAATSGGGDCMGKLNYCTLSNNSVKGSGGGSYQWSPDGIYTPTLNNCLIVSNYCYGNGGGVYFPNVNGSISILTNCTIVGNTATNLGGGVYASLSGILKNCIIYGNYNLSALVGSSNVFSIKLTNCWTSDPLYVQPEIGDYRLQTNSPCINAGNNAFVSSATDLDGNPRIAGGTVDIGAYEYQAPGSVISYAWLQQYGLPVDGSADRTDSDGDGMSNYAEWIAGTNPTNAASALMLNAPSNGAPGLKITWQSVNTRTYYLQRTTNFMAAPVFSFIQSNIVGQAGTTTYADVTATNDGPYFYRVGVQ